MKNIYPSHYIPFEESKLYAHIISDFCNGDINEANHLFATIADIIQDPATVKRNAHIFAGPEGTGKGTFSSWLVGMLGVNNAIVIDNIARYFEKFNALTAYKLLKIFEENSSEGAAYKNAEKLKAEITGKDETVEKKRKDPFQIANCSRYFFFSNHMENVVKAEGEASRFTFHKISGAHANNKAYFAELLAEVNDPDFIKSSFQYFSTLKYDPVTVLGAYKNTVKKEQQLANNKTGYKFIIDLIEENYAGVSFADTTGNEPQFRYPAAGLNREFRTSYGFSREDTLKNQLKQLGIEIKTMINHRDGSKPTKCYKIYPPDVEKALQKYFADDTYKFDLAIEPEPAESPAEQPLSDADQLRALEIQMLKLKHKMAQSENNIIPREDNGAQ